MKTQVFFLICALLVAYFFPKAVRPFKIILLDTLVNICFRMLSIPDPLENPYGWIEAVRKIQDTFSWTRATNAKNYEIHLADGRTNLIRIFFPNDKNETNLAVLLWFHGGGYCLGNYSYEDPFLYPLSQSLNAIVVSIDYRLAPEHKIPSALTDAALSFQWVVENIHKFGGNNSKIFIGGESSGASISMILSYYTRDYQIRNGIKIRGLYLNCPGVLLLDSVSCKLYRNGYILDQHWIRVFSYSAVNKIEDWKSELASPINYKNFSGLPTTLVHLANLDVVRDGTLHLVQRLHDENHGKVIYRIYDNLPHAGISSFRWFFKTESNDAIDHIVEWINDVLSLVEDYPAVERESSILF